MPENTAREEAQLEKLAKAVRTGWAKRHPLSEKHRGVVRGAVRRQWEEYLSPEERRKKAEELRRRMEEEQKRERTQAQGRAR